MGLCTKRTYTRINGSNGANDFDFWKYFRYAVPDIPYSIGASVSQEELKTFVNALLQETGDAKSSKPIDFEFIISSEFLRYVLLNLFKELGKRIKYSLIQYWFACLNLNFQNTIEWTFERAFDFIRRCCWNRICWTISGTRTTRLLAPWWLGICCANPWKMVSY